MEHSHLIVELYIYIYILQGYFINDKFQSSYVQCTLEEIKELILTQLLPKHDVMMRRPTTSHMYHYFSV